LWLWASRDYRGADDLSGFKKMSGVRGKEQVEAIVGDGFVPRMTATGWSRQLSRPYTTLGWAALHHTTPHHTPKHSTHHTTPHHTTPHSTPRITAHSTAKHSTAHNTTQHSTKTY